jgi:Rad51
MPAVDDAFEVEPLLPSGEAEPFEPLPRPTRPAGATEEAAAPRLRFAPRSRRRSSGRALLPSEPALFPWLARRFAPGEATLWTGARVAVEPILELLYAGSARARGQVSLLEGANRFHPYRVGELGRSLGVDATETLHRLRLARAFTAYQMVALVDGWAAEARRHPPTLLVAHDLPALFAADEIPDDERAALLRHVARTLRALTESVHVPLLVTLDPGGFERFPGLAEDGPRWCDYLSFVRRPGTLSVRALRDDARLAFVPRPAGQHGIEEFGDGSGAEEVIAWGAPPRRTVRRSRSG